MSGDLERVDGEVVDAEVVDETPKERVRDPYDFSQDSITYTIRGRITHAALAEAPDAPVADGTTYVVFQGKLCRLEVDVFTTRDPGIRG